MQRADAARGWHGGGWFFSPRKPAASPRLPRFMAGCGTERSTQQLKEKVVAMGMPLEALEAEVLQLRTEDRVRLLDRVVASLDADAAREAAWDAVAARRDAAAQHDPTLMVSMDDALTRLRASVA